MSIAATTGVKGNNSGAVTSIVTGNLNSTTGRDIVFEIVLGSTASSVSSITNSAGAYGAFTFRVAKNGTGVRTEIWTVHVNTGATTQFTINITGGATSVMYGAE